MPGIVSMNGSSTDKISTQRVIEGKLLADSTIDSILSNLHDFEKTHLGVEAMLQIILRTPAIEKMVSTFFSKAKEDSYLASCSSFQKRLLLFNIVQCLMHAEYLEVQYTSERLTPMETVLRRLADISVACEDLDQEEFCMIWVQSIKQTVFMFLKNNEPMEASKILVMNRNNLSKDDREELENLIKECSETENLINEIVQRPGNDFATYFTAMADLIEELNASFEETMLGKFVGYVNDGCDDSVSVGNANGPSEPNGRDDISDESDDKELIEHHVHGHEQSVNARDNQPQTVSAEAESDEVSVSDLTEEDEKSIHSEQENAQSDVQSEPSDDKNKKDNVVDSISPKISLQYRLKKQSHRSGIIIPCKHIVEHCRKVNHEEEEDKENEKAGFFNMPSTTGRGKLTTSTPMIGRGSISSRSSFKSSVLPRNLLLGERFEDLNKSMVSTDGRSYSKRKRNAFTVELDTFIIAGCRKFGVGQWSKISNAFSFPSTCTNVKIKDRFRTLIKLNYIALLDDGDFTVLSSELKSRLPAAEAKLSREDQKHKKSTRKPPTSEKEGSLQSWLKVRSDSSTNRHRQLTKPTTSNLESDRESTPPKPTQKEVDVMSMSSSGEEQPSTSKPQSFKNKFTAVEDAYLLVGARHLGLRWNMLKEYFDFQTEITSSDMQNRWDALLAEGKIEIPDEDGSNIYCHDSDLENRCEDVTNQLKQKIQDQRKSFANTMENEETIDSESEASSNIPQHLNKIPVKQQRRKTRVIESDISDIEELDQDVRNSTFKAPGPAVSSKLNKSIDAGTQTKKQRRNLRRQSPSLLDGISSSSDSSGSEDEKKTENMFEVGSPIRPSTINLFKQRRQGKKRRRDSNNSAVNELRERRQRELARQQRKKAPIKKSAWTNAETDKLIEGLKKHGPGKWSIILDDSYDLLKDRTSVMIKDKFRTMIKQGRITDEMLAEWEEERGAKK